MCASEIFLKQIERRKRELELRKVQEEEAKLSRLKDSWREKERDRRREKQTNEDEDFLVEKKEKKKEKRRRKREKRQREEAEERAEDDQEEEAEGGDLVAAAGLEESDEDNEAVRKPSSTSGVCIRSRLNLHRLMHFKIDFPQVPQDRQPRKRGRRQALSESEDEEIPQTGARRYVDSEDEGDEAWARKKDESPESSR